MALTILATGDIHLGKKSSGVRRDTEEIATKYSWKMIVDLAIDQKVDVLVLTGDIVDRNNRYYEAIGPLQAGFEKLKEAEIEVYMVAGNHDFDVLPQITDPGKYKNIHLLGKNGTWENTTFSKNGKSIRFTGWSFPKMYVNEDPLTKLDDHEPDPSVTTIGLVHGDVNVPDSKYIPLDLNNLIRTPAQAWILGHIHKPQILNAHDPIIIYPGSPHALSAKEQGPHGPILLTVNSPDDIQLKKITLSPVRYETLEIDITNHEDEESVRSAITSKLKEDFESKETELEGVSFLIYDIILTGRHRNIRDLEKWALPAVNNYEQEINSTGTLVSVRKIQFDVKTKVDNLKELAQEMSPAGVVARTILALEQGKSTPFSDHLLKAWKSVRNDLRETATYQPIHLPDEDGPGQDEEAKHYILNECNRILAELINQQQS